jgi:hypothetical protein
MGRQVQIGRESTNNKNKVDTVVTVSHIVVTLAYTISQAVIIFNRNMTQNWRMISAFVFFGGLSDIFLSLMIWFILDSNRSLTMMVDGDKVYAVAEIVNTSLSRTNEDCDAEGGLENSTSRLSRPLSTSF